MIWSFVLLAPICACYVLWECGVVKNVAARDLTKDFVDISPAVILLAFNRPWAAVFLMLCLMANMFIYDNWVVGGVLFAAAYMTASIFSAWLCPFDIMLVVFGLVLALGAAVPIAHACQGSALFKVGLVFYSVLAIAPLTYAFAKTANLGFLFLILGDIGLGVYEICGAKWVKVAANILYFAGTCFVPLSL